MIPVESDPERIKLALAYIGSMKDLDAAARAVQHEIDDPPEGLSEEQKLKRQALLAIVLKLFATRQVIYLGLIQHNLIPTEIQFPDERTDGIHQ